VLSPRQRREHKRRIAELAERSGPALQRLPKVLQQTQAAASG
jgi:hypothetical protein